MLIEIESEIKKLKQATGNEIELETEVI